MNWASLRIGLVGPLPPPAGGIANQTFQLAQLLRSEGACVELVRTNPPHWPAWIGSLRGVRAAIRLVPYLVRLWRAAGRVDLFHVMANSGWSWHLFAAPAIWMARLRGVPVVVNYRGGEAEPFLRRSIGLIRPTVARTSAVVVPSGFLQGVFARFGITSTIVPNIVDTVRFHPDPGRRRGAPHLVVARSLEPIYDVATALRAFARVHAAMPGARMTIAGAGPERTALEGLARELGIGSVVRFAGWLDRDAMAELYRTADIALNPSLVDNMPNSVLEAFACGVPVVSTRVGGVPFIVDDGVTALLVEPGDHVAMADASLRVLRDAALAARLAKAGLEEVQRYTWASVRDGWGDVYFGVHVRPRDAMRAA
jgi:glycosyltransferase involved in cell wall biosynthesis